MATAAQPIALADVYRDNFDFVWRTLGQFGVTTAALEDAAHDVFLVVHRRLVDFDETKGSMRAWLYGIARKVADKYRRGQARSQAEAVPEQAPPTPPDRHVELSQAATLVQEFLDGVDPERREVFVMTEVEGMSAPEIAAALDLKLNTVYSRLRLGRAAFERAVERFGDEDREQVTRARQGEEAPAGAAAAAWILFEPRILESSWIGAASGWSLREQVLVFLTTVAVGGGLVAGLAAVLSPSPSPDAVVVDTQPPAPGPTPKASAVESTAVFSAPKPEVGPAPEPARTATPSRTKRKPATVAAHDEPAGIDREAGLLKQAKSQVRSGDPSGALVRLTEHEREFPDSRLSDVRDAIRIQALCASGKQPQARAEAKLFSSRHPGSQLGAAVRDACDG